MRDTIRTAALEALRLRLRSLELDAVAIAARVEQCREDIHLLENPSHVRLTVVPMPEPEEPAA